MEYQKQIVVQPNKDNLETNDSISNANSHLSQSSHVKIEQKSGVDLNVGTTNVIDFTIPLPFLDYNKELDIEIKSSKPLTGKQYLLLIPITKFFKKYRNIYLLINILNGRSIISLRLIEYFVVNYVLENNTHYNLTKYRNKPEFIVDNLFTSGPPTIDITSESIPQVENNSLSLKDEIRMSILENKVKSNLQITTPDQAITELNTNNFDDYFLVHDNYKCQLKEYNKKNFDPFCRWTRIRMYYDKTKFFYTTVAQLNFFKWAIENYVLDYILDNLVTIEKAMNDYEKAIKKEKKIRKLNMQQSIPLASTVNQITHTENKNTTNPIILNTALDIDIDIDINIIPDSATTSSLVQNDTMASTPNSIISAQQQLPQIASSNTGKKITHTLFSTLDKKSKIKGRKKKEFTKTNRSILKYTCTKIVNFD